MNEAKGDVLDFIIIEIMCNLGQIKVNVADNICRPFGFLSEKIVICPDGLEATIKGVGLDINGREVLWYVKDHPTVRGRACCWGGKETNLLKAGFKEKTS